MDNQNYWSEHRQGYNNFPNSNMFDSGGMMGQQQYQSFGPQMMPQSGPQRPSAPCDCPQCSSRSFQSNFHDMSLNQNSSIPPVPSPIIAMSSTLSNSSSSGTSRSRTGSQQSFLISTSQLSPLVPNSSPVAPKEDKRRKLETPEDPDEAARLEKKRKTNKESAARARAKKNEIIEGLKKLLATMGNLDEQIEATESIEQQFRWIHESEIGADMRRKRLNTELLVSDIRSINEWFVKVKKAMDTNEGKEENVAVTQENID